MSDRIITARFNSKYIKTTCVQVYAPTNDAEPEVKDEFYEQLQAVIERAASNDGRLERESRKALTRVRKE